MTLKYSNSSRNTTLLTNFLNIPFFLRHLTVPQHPGAVREELSVEEAVHHPQLQHDVDQAEQLAAPVPQRVQFVRLERDETVEKPEHFERLYYILTRNIINEESDFD